MNRTSLIMRAVVAFAFLAIENAARAQTIPVPAWIYPAPPALQWTPMLGTPIFGTPIFAPASPLRTYGQAGAPGFQLGPHGENRPGESGPEWLSAANQPRGVCRRRTPARGLEPQRSGF
jgi:hypothetical protein